MTTAVSRPVLPRARTSRPLRMTLVLVVTVVGLISSLGAPLMPAVALSRDVSPAAAQWTLTVTMLAGAIATPVLGRLGDGPHRRAVIVTTLVLVAAGCALAIPNGGFALLLAGRALQGLGLGLMPLAMAVARDLLPADQGRHTVRLLSVTTVVGAGIGYPISGGLAVVGGLAASYWFGFGVVLFALVLTLVWLPGSRHLAPQPLDLAGAALLGTGVTAALGGVTRGGDWGWHSWPVLGLWAGAGALLVLWTRHESRSSRPLVQVRLLRSRALLQASATAVTAGVGIYILMSTVSWLLQAPGGGGGAGFGESALVAACAMVPFSAANVLAFRLVPRLAPRADDASVMTVGCLVFCLALVALAVVRDDVWMVFAVMAVGGIGSGCTFSAMPSIIVGAVPGTEVGSAVGFNQVLRTVGYATGSAVTTAALSAHESPVSGVTESGGFTVAAVIGAGVFAATCVVGVLLGPGRPLRSTPDAGVDLMIPPGS